MMTVPLYCLLFFAMWTLLVVFFGIGVFRVGNVLLGRAKPNSFPADTPHGPDWYRRVARAHANCVENLGPFGAVVLVGHLVGLTDGSFANLALAYVAARVAQTIAHIASGRSLVINIRFTFFITQLVCLGAMVVMILRHG
ncbi:hypothetical protein LBMAG42_00910 [Deltaproteobacteria bacterium]|nr:hypothetical protein LBMAG42_00910 [Deltaproteobacteria bacterium]